MAKTTDQDTALKALRDEVQHLRKMINNDLEKRDQRIKSLEERVEALEEEREGTQ
jgi:hypothetical protein